MLSVDSVHLARDCALDLIEPDQIGPKALMISAGVLCSADALHFVDGDLLGIDGFHSRFENHDVAGWHWAVCLDPYQFMHAAPSLAI